MHGFSRQYVVLALDLDFIYSSKTIWTRLGLALDVCFWAIE